MKELTLEQKAQAYEEALDNAKVVYKTIRKDLKPVIEQIFPEIKESENDRIKKALIDYFDNANKADENPLLNYGIHTDKVIAWIEKQGEQKPTDKVEPKFHEGDWITNGDYTWKIVGVKPLDYILQSQDGNIVDDTISHVDNNFHIWTIKDAKDGDVLICKGNVKYSNGIKYERICLFKNLDNAFFTLTKTSNYVEEYDIDVNIDYPNNTVPATKEQKEILFMAMADAGYTFDFEKKVLKKIEQNSDWSEKDDIILNDTFDILSSYYSSNDDISLCDKINKIENWLEALEDRVQPQPKQGLSEEDKRKLSRIYSILGQAADTHAYSTTCRLIGDKECVELQDFLKSLRQRIGG